MTSVGQVFENEISVRFERKYEVTKNIAKDTAMSMRWRTSNPESLYVCSSGTFFVVFLMSLSKDRIRDGSTK